MKVGITVSYESVRQWCLKFGDQYAQKLRKRRGQSGDKWHVDEVFIKINGKTHYLWRAVDQNGPILDILVTKRRKKRQPTKSKTLSYDNHFLKTYQPVEK